ncbi:MAG: hypothetical protein WCK09_00985 [Bacteroidota bacterium]
MSQQKKRQHIPQQVNRKKNTSINGVTLTPADSKIDVSDLFEIFTGKNIEAKSLRTEAWRRK